MINDLKQFITVTVSQQIADVRNDIKKMDNKLSSKIDDLSASVAEAMTTSNEEVDSQLKGHETCISKLETRTV